MVFLSKLLDPVSGGWWEYIRSGAATALWTEESGKPTFPGVCLSARPARSEPFSTKVERWPADSRILAHEAILLEGDDRTYRGWLLNPIELLLGGEGNVPTEHCCVGLIENQTKVQPDLRETPSQRGLKLNGSSSNKGRRA